MVWPVLQIDQQIVPRLQLGADGAFDPDAEKRRAWVVGVAEKAKLAKQLGCACIGMWPGGGLRGQTIDQAIARLAESFRAVGELAGERGILAAFEIEPPFIFNTEDHLQRILAATNHPNLKTIYDPSHFDLMNGSTGRPHEMLERIGVAKLRRAAPEFVREHTGQVIGGVSPIGHPVPVPTYIDPWLRKYDEVWAAAGHPAAVFSTTFDELVAMTGAVETAVD